MSCAKILTSSLGLTGIDSPSDLASHIFETTARMEFMFKSICKMFAKPTPAMTEAATAFIEQLAKSDIWILAVGLRGTPSITNVNDPAAFDIIAAHRKDLAEVGDDDSVFPFNYQRDGRQIFPFFSSEDRAKQFAVNGAIGDSSLFQPYCLLAGLSPHRITMHLNSFLIQVH